VPDHNVSIRAEFLRPVELPSTGQLSLGTVEAGAEDGFVWRCGSRICLFGTVGAGAP
jgi:hypothetical protein